MRVNQPRPFAGALETNTDGHSGGHGEERRAELAVQIDNEVVLIAAKRAKQI